MSTPDTDRVSVSVTLPAYQRDEWTADAEELGMSRAEFVRTMVQAGRRDFGFAETTDAETEEPDVPPSPPRGEGLEDRVQAVLRERGPLSWDALLDAVSDEIEDRLEDALTGLQASGRVRYSGRDGGYVVVDE